MARAAGERLRGRAVGDKAGALPLHTLDSLLAYEPDPREEIWPGGVLSMGEAAGLIGAPGVGKSRLALQAALCTILGKEFLGWPTRGSGLRWLFLQTENSARRLKADLTAMTAHLPASHKARLRDCFRVLDVGSLDFATICMTDGSPDRERILATLEAWPADVVVIDPLRDAGRGDPNKDADMTETCQGISSVVRHGNPQRVPLVIHHGRTGAAEAAKVFGDDAASFGRNSKVLHGWLRSQINVAPAGGDDPDIVIVGCGKNSNGPKWEPFAARLDARAMTYRRLDAAEFDIGEWAEGAGGGKPRKKMPTAQDVANVVRNAGGEVRGGKNDPGGLAALLRREFGVSWADALTAIEAAAAEVEATVADVPGARQPVRVYRLKRV